MQIVGLGYCGFGAPDPRQWLTFGRDVIGLMPAPTVPGEVGTETGFAADGSLYLKADEWSWRVAIHPQAENKGLLYMGLEVRGPLELATALSELQAAGYPTEKGTKEQAHARAVSAIGYTRDPAGNVLELFYGPLVDRNFRSPHNMHFLTGDMGLGHINLIVDELERCQAFYTEILGFRLTDYYSFGERMSANFYHCNPRHHSVGLLRVGPVNGVHHLMFQVPTVDDVGKALDRAEAAGITITASLGRHSNDHMFSFYMASPFGFQVEVGCDAIRVGPDWTPRQQAPGDLWGHKGLTADALDDDASKLRQEGTS